MNEAAGVNPGEGAWSRNAGGGDVAECRCRSPASSVTVAVAAFHFAVSGEQGELMIAGHVCPG